MRGWLQKNKIFFETVAASLLGLMSVFVAIAAVYVGVQANNIADYQGQLAERELELLESETIPWIEVRIDSVSGSDEEFPRAVITVENVSGRVVDFQIEARTFFSAQIETEHERDVATWAASYYDAPELTYRPTGVLATVRSSGIESTAYFLNEGVDFHPDLHARMASFTVFRIQYQDLLDDSYEEYWAIPAYALAPPIVARGTPLVDQAGERCWALWEELFSSGKSISVRDIDAGTLIEKWEEDRSGPDLVDPDTPGLVPMFPSIEGPICGL